MTFPDDLPYMIEYRMSAGHIRTTLPRVKVRYISSSGATNAAIVCPQIPLGATGWRRAGGPAWMQLADIPPAWRPFLDRKPGTEMDPRPKPKAGAQ